MRGTSSQRRLEWLALGAIGGRLTDSIAPATWIGGGWAEDMANNGVDLTAELQALDRARRAVDDKLESLAGFRGSGADALADEYMSAVVRGTVEKLQNDLVVFGRIDDDLAWRVGLYGIDSGGEQLVVDWRAPFARGFYQARLGDDLGLARRVSYVGCIDDLYVEEFSSGEVTGSSPLMAELHRSRGSEMRAAVATLQAEQDDLVRLDPDDTLVLRGGPGTGKTVVGLHRAAWLVYNDRRLTADKILVVGPSDAFLRFVAAVLPTLGEARIEQTTFDRLFGEADDAAEDPRWVEIVEAFAESLYRPGPVPLGPVRTIPEDEVVATIDRLRARSLPWQDRRRVFVESLARAHDCKPAEISNAAKTVWPSMTAKQALAKLSNPKTLIGLGVDSADAPVLAAAAKRGGGALADEVRATFQGLQQKFSHVIVDEAQDMSLLRLRAVQRRAKGLTLVGDDAQRTHRHGLGLRVAAATLGVEPTQMGTAYRMSAEIADWLNAHAEKTGLDAVELVGIRPTGRPVATATEVSRAQDDLRARWENVAVIRPGEVEIHKGVEYDAVVVDGVGMDAKDLYLAASRAAHELVIVS